MSPIDLGGPVSAQELPEYEPGRVLTPSCQRSGGDHVNGIRPQVKPGGSGVVVEKA